VTDDPILIEEITDGFENGTYTGSENGEYTQRWMTDPPPVGVGFRVLRQSWNEDFTVRTIHEVRVE
jgi:hypothetical protein